jgi:chemotaxis protein histidine kinase CheA
MSPGRSEKGRDVPGRERREGPSPAAPTGGRRHAIVAVDGVEYAVDASRVRRSLPAPTTPSPDLVFLGQTYPLVDLRALFRRASPADADRVVLLVHGETDRAGLVVDALVELTALDDAAVVPLPAVFRGVERRWFGGLARIGGRVVVVLRVDAVVGAHAVLSPRLAPRASVAR